MPVQAVQRHGAALRTQCRASRGKDGNDVYRNSYTGPYTVRPPTVARANEVVAMPDVTSIVFVVDDDVSVRESLELLISTAGWSPETFASAQEFLSHPRPDGSVLPGARCDASGPERPGAARAAGRPHGHADHLHHRLRGRAHDRASHEGRSGRVPDEALQRRRCCWMRSAAPSSGVARHLREESEMQALRSCYASLTPREREVMELVVSGSVEQTDRRRTWHQRDHREGTPRSDQCAR